MDFQPNINQIGTKYGNNRWEVYSPKIKRRVSLFSDLEYYNWLENEMNPDIIDFCEQPTKILNSTYSSLSKKYTIPDLIVENSDHRMTLIEVKHKTELDDERVKQQILLQKQWAKDHDMNFKIFTEDILKNRYYLSIWKQIIQVIASPKPEYLSVNINNIISNSKLEIPITIKTILDNNNEDQSAIINAIYHLIYEGRIGIPKLTDRFSMNTEVIIYG